MNRIFLILFGLIIINAYGQTDSTKSPFTLSSYIEAYYTYDFGNPANHTRPSFVYCYNRENEININLAMIKLAYERKKTRANLALMVGSYPNVNLASEPGVLKNIYEANIGVKISNKKDLWIDAGVFTSHIGFESAIGKDCWTLTRSMIAENTPYYETGAKMSYNSANGQWFLCGLVLNGWQHMERPDGNNTPAVGTQITFKPSQDISINSSSFLGSDSPDSTHLIRYFRNVYGQFQLHPKLGLILGFDIGAQQKAKAIADFNYWYAVAAIGRFSASKRVNIAARTEYYADPSQVLVATNTPNGFQTFSYSLNVDYLITDNALWRIEGRGFKSKDKDFELHHNPSNQNYVLTTALSVFF